MKSRIFLVLAWLSSHRGVKYDGTVDIKGFGDRAVLEGIPCVEHRGCCELFLLSQFLSKKTGVYLKVL
jgi:hypothetical protein